MTQPVLEQVFLQKRQLLWGLCYRMTGDPALSDDLVQETYVRAKVKPPRDVTRDFAPWLVAVALNLARDALRRRRRMAYTGPWLPAPISTEEIGGEEPDGKYSLRESATYAFLVALEALNSKQRAIFLLSEVFDYADREIAELLHLSLADIKTSLYRARKRLASYDKARCEPDEELYARHELALSRLMAALASGELNQVVGALVEDVVTIQDAGAQRLAARNIVFGAPSVAKLYIGLMKKVGAPVRIEVVSVNGLPALWVELAPREDPRMATQALFRCEVSADGRIAALHALLSPEKLARFGKQATVCQSA